jgi:hypothetical protein
MGFNEVMADVMKNSQRYKEGKNKGAKEKVSASPESRDPIYESPPKQDGH